MLRSLLHYRNSLNEHLPVPIVQLLQFANTCLEYSEQDPKLFPVHFWRLYSCFESFLMILTYILSRLNFRAIRVSLLNHELESKTTELGCACFGCDRCPLILSMLRFFPNSFLIY